jgi:hypothetical protein
MVQNLNLSIQTLREGTRERAGHDVRAAARPERLDQTHWPTSLRFIALERNRGATRRRSQESVI